MSKQIKGTSFASKKEKNATGSRTVVHLPNSASQNDAVLSFGAVLRKYRIKNEMSQPKLAELMGISRNTITNWENDKCRPEVDSIRELCTMLGIPLYELFGLSNDSIPSPHENIILSQFNIKKNTYISTHSDINFSDYYTPSGVDNEEEYDFIHNKVYNSVEASYYDMLGDSVKTACDNIIQDETELTRKELVDNISQSIAASSLSDDEKKLYKILFVDGVSAKNASLMMHMKYSDVIKSKKTIKNFILKRFSSSI